MRILLPRALPGEKSQCSKGRLDYRHGNHVYSLEPGDSLTFDSIIPYGPELLKKVPIRMLSLINYEHD